MYAMHLSNNWWDIAIMQYGYNTQFHLSSWFIQYTCVCVWFGPNEKPKFAFFVIQKSILIDNQAPM